MTSHIARHRRWWNVPQILDNAISMSQFILGGLTLDQAGFSVLETNMVLTSTKNNLDAG